MCKNILQVLSLFESMIKQLDDLKLYNLYYLYSKQSVHFYKYVIYYLSIGCSM